MPKFLGIEISDEEFDEIEILDEKSAIEIREMFKKDHVGTYKKLNGTSFLNMLFSHEKLRAILRARGVEIK